MEIKIVGLVSEEEADEIEFIIKRCVTRWRVAEIISLSLKKDEEAKIDAEIDAEIDAKIDAEIDAELARLANSSSLQVRLTTFFRATKNLPKKVTQFWRQKLYPEA